MKQIPGILMLFLAFACAARSGAAAMPDGCGEDKAKFDVATRKGQPEPAPPGAGKAQIVFIETLDGCAGCSTPPMRFGGDGEWAGADKGDSYFTVDVLPGVHHLCAAWQGSFGESKKEPRWIEFAAAAGKVYYFEAKVAIVTRLTGVGIDATTETDGTVNFAQLSEDEGKRRVNASALSVSKRKK
jgi:hypothetical protein